MISFKQFLAEQTALQFASIAHANQKRAGGAPYIIHPIAVAKNVEFYKQKSKNMQALLDAAHLHDTVEDTGTTLEQIGTMFGPLVASLVQELTSDSDKVKMMGKDKYLAHKMSNMSNYGLVIKLADRLDNVKNISTARTPEWRARYKAETEHIIAVITQSRVLSPTHKRIIDAIRLKLGEVK